MCFQQHQISFDDLTPEAIHRQVKIRIIIFDGLDQLADDEERLGKRAAEYNETVVFNEDYDTDDLSSDEMEDTEERVADHASAAITISELEAEIKTLKSLENLANQVRVSGTDRKWDELSQLLQDNECMYTPAREREKLMYERETAEHFRSCRILG